MLIEPNQQKEHYHIVARGFDAFSIANYSPNLPDFPDSTKKTIDNFVENAKIRAEQVGGCFYDGDLIGVFMDKGKWKTKAGLLSVDATHIKYSMHAGLFRPDNNSEIQAFYVNGILVTKDGFIGFGQTQAAEADFMGKLSLPAGTLKLAPDNYPSAGAAILQQLQKEMGLAGSHIEDFYLGWINGMSKREGNYHLTLSFIVPIVFTKKEMLEYFAEWSHSQEKLIKNGNICAKPDFKGLFFLPNNKKYLSDFIDEQDSKAITGNPNMLGKSLDVLEEWTRYGCSIDNLEEYKRQNGPEVNLPQPGFD